MKRSNILVVDPAGEWALQIEALLDRHGFGVESCNQLQVLTQRLLVQRYDLIMLPIPSLETTLAIELMQRLRQQSESQYLPILVTMSDGNRSTVELLEQMLKHSRVDFIQLPIDGRLLALKCQQNIRANEFSSTIMKLPEGVDSAIPRLGSLSKRETEILNFVGEGLSNREISYELTLSEHSVRTHIYHIFAKLGLKRRSQAVLVQMYRKLTASSN